MYSNIAGVIHQIFTSRCGIAEHWNIYCPGCGGTRAFIALTHLDILGSLYYNPILVLIIINILLCMGLRIYENNNHLEHRNWKVRNISRYMTLSLWIIYVVVRDYLLVFQGIDLLGDMS